MFNVDSLLESKSTQKHHDITIDSVDTNEKAKIACNVFCDMKSNAFKQKSPHSPCTKNCLTTQIPIHIEDWGWARAQEDEKGEDSWQWQPSSGEAQGFWIDNFISAFMVHHESISLRQGMVPSEWKVTSV